MKNYSPPQAHDHEAPRHRGTEILATPGGLMGRKRLFAGFFAADAFDELEKLSADVPVTDAEIIVYQLDGFARCHGVR